MSFFEEDEKFLQENLFISLVTYNRKDYLKRTLDKLLEDSSPLRNVDITILDNASDDGSSELIDEYCLKYSNLVHIKHKINIGGNANITRGFELGATSGKKYFWVLCDDDKYDFENISEVILNMKKEKDVIVTCDYCIDYTPDSNIEISDLLLQLTFVPAGIYKSTLMDENIFTNMYHSIYAMFPHLCIPIHVYNTKKDFTLISKPIVFQGLHCENPCKNFSYTRGLDKREITKFHKNVSWTLGFANVITLLNDKALQKKVFQRAVINDDIYGNWKNFYFCTYQKYFSKETFSYLIDILGFLPLNKILKFFLKSVYWKLTFRKMRLETARKENKIIQDKQFWLEYFEKNNIQKYIDNLAKKFMGKKVLLYGYGLVTRILLENYDLSKLNIVAISDRKFLGCDIKQVQNFELVSPNKIKLCDYDLILISLKQFDNIKKSLRHKGLKKPIYGIIKGVK